MLLSFAVLFLLPTAAHVVLLKYCLVSLSGSCSLRSARIIFGPTQAVSILTVNDCCEGRLWVKGRLVFGGWLKVGERWLNRCRNAAKRGRWASITYETSGTGFELSGEDFQNIETFVVVRSSVFSTSSAYKTHLARDAYHAYSRRASGCQGLFF